MYNYKNDNIIKDQGNILLRIKDINERRTTNTKVIFIRFDICGIFCVWAAFQIDRCGGGFFCRGTQLNQGQVEVTLPVLRRPISYNSPTCGAEYTSPDGADGGVHSSRHKGRDQEFFEKKRHNVK